MTRGHVEIAALALFAWREGQRLAPGSRDAMLGVAHVIDNRTRQGWHHDWLEAIQAAPKYAANELAEFDCWTMPGDEDGRTFDWLVGQLERLYNHELSDEVTSSATLKLYLPESKVGLFYCDLGKVTREWFMEKIIRAPENHQRTAECQPITFWS